MKPVACSWRPHNIVQKDPAKQAVETARIHRHISGRRRLVRPGVKAAARSTKATSLPR